MDSKSKKIHVGNNLLVGLKAELLRKQEQNKKPAPETNIRFRTKRSEVNNSKKSKNKTSKEPRKNYECNPEELAELEKARKILEKKAKLYDQMTKDVMSIDDSSSLPFLVDFEQKAIDEVRDLRVRGSNPSADRHSDSEDEDSEWVDYVDSLGRSRRCLRKDLPHFEEMDKKLAPPKPAPMSTSGEPHLLSNDMKREIERQKWEEAVNELRTKENIHYSDVMFNEIRDHGVGFFNFSRDEKTRKEQMDLLKKLREQTKMQRKMFASMKEKKRKMLEIRLAKIMQRKVVQEAIKVSGLDAHTLIAGLKEDEEEPEADEEMVGLVGDGLAADISKEEEDEKEEEANLLKRDDSWRRNAPIREWDVGKKEFDEDAWLNKRREERLSEFAPKYADGASQSGGLKRASPADDSEDMVALNLKKLRMLIA